MARIKKGKPGFTIVEILLAIGVFVLSATTITYLLVDASASNQQGSDRIVASTLAASGLEAARNIRDSGWNNLTAGDHGLALANGVWTFSGTSDTDASGRFSRKVSISSVSSDKMLVTSTVNWSSNPTHPVSISFSTYLENWSQYTTPWYSTAGSWLYRQQITINPSQVAAAQSGFPMLVKITDPTNPIFANSRSDGFDIFFTDSSGTTKLAAEREKFDASGKELDFWLNTSLSATAGSPTVIYMYYGNPSASDMQTVAPTSTAVWDANCKGIYHLKETGSGNAADYKDSAGSANNSTSTINQPSGIAGEIGGAESLNGTSQYLTFGNSTINPNTTSFTVEGWINNSGSWNKAGIISQNADGNNLWQIVSGKLSGAANDFALVVFKGGSNYTVESPATLVTGTWYHVVATWNGTTPAIYINGALPAQTADNSSSWSKGTADNKLWIGSKSDKTSYAAGTLDEIRLSNIARSATWITTEYNNQNSPSTFYALATATMNPNH